MWEVWFAVNNRSGPPFRFFFPTEDGARSFFGYVEQLSNVDCYGILNPEESCH